MSRYSLEFENPIKVNYTNYRNNRTSTTVSVVIAWFWFNNTGLANTSDWDEITEYARYDRVAKALQDYLNRDRWVSKHQIETMLLIEAKFDIAKNAIEYLGEQ